MKFGEERRSGSRSAGWEFRDHGGEAEQRDGDQRLKIDQVGGGV